MRLYGVEEMEGRAILRPVSSETLGTGERVGQFHPLPCSLREDNKVFSRHFWNNLWDKDGHWGTWSIRISAYRRKRQREEEWFSQGVWLERRGDVSDD